MLLPKIMVSRKLRRAVWCALFLVSVLCLKGYAQRLVVDASEPFVEPRPLVFRGGTASSPTGEVIAVNSRYITRNGKPWLPVVGEFHFSRYPEAEWEEEILKMKAGGVEVVGTYILWIHHEEIEGQFDWTGQRNLRRFVELCAKHGMYVFPRIGPWAHAEARNGGFPDWVVKRGKMRTVDPVFWEPTARLYQQIAAQLKGLYWKDGGPVIGIQIENEYTNRNRAAGDAYILALKRMAIADGMDVPLYTVTGWQNANVPAGEVLPVRGGYPDAPWDTSLTKMPSSQVYNFHPDFHGGSNMGMIGAKPGAEAVSAVEFPKLTVEMGGGVQDTYHRRPVVSADDVAAMEPVAIGSGVNLYGTYLFHGAENPDGKLTTLQESRKTGYSTDVPVKSYDFQAPLSLYGEERESFRKVKLFNYFLNDFGSDLAPMTVHTSADRPSDTDLAPVRLAIRSQGERGYVFVNNYVRGATMPEHADFQVEVKLAGRTMLIPEKPLTVPSGAYFIWPFHLDVGGTILRYSTAQPFTHSGDDFSFSCISGVRCDFAFEATDGVTVDGAVASRTRRGGVLYLEGVQPDTVLVIRRKEKNPVTILVTSQERAEHTWKAEIDGQRRLVVTRQQFYASKDKMVFEAEGSPEFEFGLLHGPSKGLQGDLPLTKKSGSVGFNVWSARAATRTVEVSLGGIHGASELAVPGKERPFAPEDAAFAKAAAWKIRLQPETMKGLSNLFLQIDYAGDVARLKVGKELLADDFYNGEPWRIGLKRFEVDGKIPPLMLQILPLRTDMPIFLEENVRTHLPERAQVVKLNQVKVIPVYRLVVDTAAVHP